MSLNKSECAKVSISSVLLLNINIPLVVLLSAPKSSYAAFLERCLVLVVRNAEMITVSGLR